MGIQSSVNQLLAMTTAGAFAVKSTATKNLESAKAQSLQRQKDAHEEANFQRKMQGREPTEFKEAVVEGGQDSIIGKMGEISAYKGAAEKAEARADDLAKETVQMRLAEERVKGKEVPQYNDTASFGSDDIGSPDDVMKSLSKRGMTKVNQMRNFYDFRDNLGRFAKKPTEDNDGKH